MKKNFHPAENLKKEVAQTFGYGNMSLMNEAIINLPDDIGQLQSMICTLNTDYKNLQETSESKIHFLEDENKYLLEKIKLLSFRLFGRKSEKLSPEDELQGRMFNEAESHADDKLPVREEKVKVPSHERKKSGRRPIPEGIPRVIVPHDLTDDEKICACGAEMKKIGEVVSEKLDIIPPKIQVM